MKTAKDLIAQKGQEVWSIGPDASVYQAIELLAEKGIGALMVLEGDKVVGIVSERDYTRKVALQQRSSKETKVRDIMTDKVVYAEPGQTLEECMAIMTDKHFRHMPVMDGEDLLGVLTLGDLVKARIAEQQILIEQLERYITG